MEREQIIDRETPLDRYERTLRFLKAATAEGAHLVPLATNPSMQKQRSWIRSIKIANDYYNSDLTLEEVGTRHGVVNLNGRGNIQNVDRILRRFINTLWHNSSDKIKRDFPSPQQISVGKPVSDKWRERLSLAKGGIRLKVLPLAQKGETNKRISALTGIPTSKISGVVYSERKKGILPPSVIESNRKLLSQLKNSPKNPRDRQTLLDQVTTRFLKDHRELFLYLREFFVKAGIGNLPRGDTPIAAEELKRLEIPVGHVLRNNNGPGPIILYFVLASKLERLQSRKNSVVNAH